jgi:hypothetical protein
VNENAGMLVCMIDPLSILISASGVELAGNGLTLSLRSNSKARPYTVSQFLEGKSIKSFKERIRMQMQNIDMELKSMTETKEVENMPLPTAFNGVASDDH